MEKKWFRFTVHITYDVAASSPEEAEDILYSLLPPRREKERKKIHWVEGEWDEPTPLSPEEVEAEGY